MIPADIVEAVDALMLVAYGRSTMLRKEVDEARQLLLAKIAALSEEHKVLLDAMNRLARHGVEYPYDFASEVLMHIDAARAQAGGRE
jgi:hypothetical protein